jgi:acyl-CoA reductase-like NAD-dependent aldehyde dehydrogenase
MTSAQLIDALFPMATELAAQVDKEMVVFAASVHTDHLDRFVPVLAEVLTAPRWDPKEFERLRTDAVNDIEKRLRTSDDENLAKEALGTLVTYECGKIFQEGLGEVQEMIDICDFAVGLSRQLYGLTIASEMPGHKMAEYWYPLGVVGVISAFNFPVAVWAWNAALAYVCGNSVVWKPSEKTPVTALACQKLLARAIARYDGEVPTGLLEVIIG